jgi:hypothetical protein
VAATSVAAPMPAGYRLAVLSPSLEAQADSQRPPPRGRYRRLLKFGRGGEGRLSSTASGTSQRSLECRLSPELDDRRRQQHKGKQGREERQWQPHPEPGATSFIFVGKPARRPRVPRPPPATRCVLGRLDQALDKTSADLPADPHPHGPNREHSKPAEEVGERGADHASRLAHVNANAPQRSVATERLATDPLQCRRVAQESPRRRAQALRGWRSDHRHPLSFRRSNRRRGRTCARQGKARNSSRNCSAETMCRPDALSPSVVTGKIVSDLMTTGTAKSAASCTHQSATNRKNLVTRQVLNRPSPERPAECQRHGVCARGAVLARGADDTHADPICGLGDGRDWASVTGAHEQNQRQRRSPNGCRADRDDAAFRFIGAITGNEGECQNDKACRVALAHREQSALRVSPTARVPPCAPRLLPEPTARNAASRRQCGNAACRS